MKLYVTKPVHHKYGRIKLDNVYTDINDLVNDCAIWVKKPYFEAPFVCIFEQTFCIRGWFYDYGYVGRFQNFPEGEVKSALKEIVLKSIGPDFKETFPNKYYKWIGELNTILEPVETEYESNFTMYLTKPCANSISARGIDLVDVWLDKPKLETFQEGSRYEYQSYNGLSSIKGKYFRKNKHFLLEPFWERIENSFDVDRDRFLEDITDYNSKQGQSRPEFLIEYYFKLKVEEQ